MDEPRDAPLDAQHHALPDRAPMALFDAWLAAAREREPNDPEAMALATATLGGLPSVRMVLLKGHGVDAGGVAGFTFYTNAHSRKGGEIRANGQAALLFHWKSLRRQVRIEGALTQVSEGEADAYFHSRARASQIGSAASDQSRPLDLRATYLARVAALEEEFAGLERIPRPPHWTGFRLAAARIEFWIDRPYRLHERRLFVRDAAAAGGWSSTLLYP